MAKVSKRKVKIEEVIEVKPSMILSHDEHLKVETSPLEVENAKLLMAIEEQSLVTLMLEFKLLEIKIEKQKNRVAECNHKYTQAKTRHAGIIGEIIKNHGLNSEKFSYNNNTGEIIL